MYTLIQFLVYKNKLIIEKNILRKYLPTQENAFGSLIRQNVRMQL